MSKQPTVDKLIQQFLAEHSITWAADPRLFKYVESHWGSRPGKSTISYALQCLREAGCIAARKYYHPHSGRQIWVYSPLQDASPAKQASQLLTLWVPAWPLYSHIRLVYRWGGAWLLAEVWHLRAMQLEKETS